MKMMVILNETEKEKLQIIKKLNTIQKQLNKWKGKKIIGHYESRREVESIIIDIRIVGSIYGKRFIIHVLYSGSIIPVVKLEKRFIDYFSVAECLFYDIADKELFYDNLTYFLQPDIN